MTTGYGRGSGFLPRPPVGKHKSTAAGRADDVKRRDAVYREGYNDGLAAGASIARVSPNVEETLRKIEEAMSG